MFRVKDWSSFQSYKDRNPPWIRLHRKLIDDYQFQKMGVEARALLPMLWLIAAEDKDPVSGMIRLDYEEVAFRLRGNALTVKAAIDEIVRAGFIVRVEKDDIDLFTDKSTSYETVTEASRIYHPETRDQTQRPESETREEKKVSEKPVDNGDKSGSFQKIVGSGQESGSAGGYDVRDSFSDKDWEEVTMAMRSYVHLSWDRKVVFEKYNGFVKNDPPKSPVKGFVGWMEKNKRWLMKPP